MSRHRARHRTPPRPQHYDSHRPGYCKFCGGAIIHQGKMNKRATWHPQCALTWTIMNNPTVARRFVFVRDRGICKTCGKDCAPGDPDLTAKIIERILSPTGNYADVTEKIPLGCWELDHVVPLSKAGNNADMWKLGNLQTLCARCHKEKTEADKLLYA